MYNYGNGYLADLSTLRIYRIIKRAGNKIVKALSILRGTAHGTTTAELNLNIIHSDISAVTPEHRSHLIHRTNIRPSRSLLQNYVTPPPLRQTWTS